MLLFTTNSSCIRQELEDSNFFFAHIPISMDWSESMVDEEYTENVSIYFFPKDGTQPYRLISGDIYFAVAQVPINDYSVLIFNDAVDNLLGINFKNTREFENFKAYVTPVGGEQKMYYNPIEKELMTALHDRIGSWTLGEISVTDEMVEYTRSNEFGDYIEEVKSKALLRSKGISDVVDNTPTPLPKSIDFTLTQQMTRSLSALSTVVIKPSTASNSLKIDVTNLNNAAKIEGVLRGIPSGANLSNNERIVLGDTLNAYKFDITSRTFYEGQEVNGSVKHNFVTFGKVEDRDARYELIINVIISTGELYTFKRDVTDQVLDSEDFNIKICLDDEHGGGITLPEGVADGFGVYDWEDGGEVDLN